MADWLYIRAPHSSARRYPPLPLPSIIAAMAGDTMPPPPLPHIAIPWSMAQPQDWTQQTSTAVCRNNMPQVEPSLSVPLCPPTPFPISLTDDDDALRSHTAAIR